MKLKQKKPTRTGSLKLRRRKGKTAVRPVPGAIPLRGRNSMRPWTIKHAPQPATSLHEHIMQADLRPGPCPACGEDHPRATRLHEMGHVVWTPLNWADRAQAKGLEEMVTQVCEDARLNRRHIEAGERVGQLMCAEQIKQLLMVEALTSDIKTMGMAAVASLFTGDEQTVREGLQELVATGMLPAETRRKVESIMGTAGSYLDKPTPTFETETLNLAQWLTRELAEAQAEHEATLARMGEEAEAAREGDDEESEEGEYLVEKDGDKITEVRDGEGLWGVMTMEYPRLKHPNNLLARRTVQRDEGVLPMRPDRVLTDGRMFTRKVHRAKLAVLVDCSGSMGWTPETLHDFLKALPATTVGYYSGSYDSGGPGVLRVVADRGRRCDDEYACQPHGHGNDVDGPALAWLGAQKADMKLWVSDGGVTGAGSTADLRRETKRLMKAGRIQMVPDKETAMAVAQGKRAFEPGRGFHER